MYTTINEWLDSGLLVLLTGGIISFIVGLFIYICEIYDLRTRYELCLKDKDLYINEEELKEIMNYIKKDTDTPEIDLFDIYEFFKLEYKKRYSLVSYFYEEDINPRKLLKNLNLLKKKNELKILKYLREEKFLSKKGKELITLGILEEKNKLNLLGNKKEDLYLLEILKKKRIVTLINSSKEEQERHLSKLSINEQRQYLLNLPKEEQKLLLKLSINEEQGIDVYILKLEKPFEGRRYCSLSTHKKREYLLEESEKNRSLIKFDEYLPELLKEEKNLNLLKEKKEFVTGRSSEGEDGESRDIDEMDCLTST